MKTLKHPFGWWFLGLLLGDALAVVTLYFLLTR